MCLQSKFSSIPRCHAVMLMATYVMVTLIAGIAGAQGPAAPAPTASSQPTPSGGQERPQAPWNGPEGPFVLVEAEQFDLDGAGWTVLDDSGKRFTHSASGFKSLSGAGRGDGTAHLTVEVPRTGQYRYWIRYARFARKRDGDRGPFGVTIAQNGKTVHQEDIDVTYDGPVQPNGGPPVPPYVWHSQLVQLQAGPATIQLTKVGRASVSSAVRKIDCLLLTTDLKHEADHRDFGPQSYLRISLDRASPQRVGFQAFFNHMRAPFYQQASFDRKGINFRMPRAPAANYLAAGEATPWLNISRLLDSGWDTNLSIKATARERDNDSDQDLATDSAYTVDFATAPREDAIVKSMSRDGPGAGLVLRIGSHVTKDKLPQSDLDIANETLKLVEALPPITFGRRPTRFPVMTDFRAVDTTHTPDTQAVELQVMKYLGINTNSVSRLNQASIDSGVLFSRFHEQVWFMGKGGFNEPDVERMSKMIAIKAKEYHDDPFRDRYVYAKLMDEAKSTPLDRLVANPVSHEAFRTWLRQRGDTPEQLGIESWDQVKILKDPDAGPAAMYVASQRFRADSVVEFFALATELSHQHFGPQLKTTQNFSDGAVYMANMYAQGNDYFMWFRRKALDMALSEDWTALGSTPQCCGWNVALLRSATKYHQQPIGMYVISYGPYIDTKLSAYSDMAQGAKSLNFYAYAPLYQGHERGWSRKPRTFQAIAELTREIGAAEHVLLDAMPPRASTAIIYSTSSDIWDAKRDNVMGHERMHTYLALRHGQVAVDVLSEDDVIEGRLKDYAAAYLFGDQLDRRACAPLAQWVKAGGSLVLAAGAGQRDEFNAPMHLLDTQLGVQRSAATTLQTMWIYGRGIDKALSSQGKITLEGADSSVDLLARRQLLTPGQGATVLARFEDGSPAALAQPVGRGRAVMHGFTPALAYVREALLAHHSAGEAQPAPASPAPPRILGVEESMQEEGETLAREGDSLVPPTFGESLRSFIVRPALEASPNQLVVVDTPQVEATLLRGAHGWVVTLANYTGRPQKRVEVTIRLGDRAFGAVHSSRGGVLADLNEQSGIVRVTLPLESTDMVFATWATP
ncbi:MAG: hypothetical protein WD042_18455 [Phycisphaeraceae bacterium]